MAPDRICALGCEACNVWICPGAVLSAWLMSAPSLYKDFVLRGYGFRADPDLMNKFGDGVARWQDGVLGLLLTVNSGQSIKLAAGKGG